ncbi:hypothetical protein M9Y10_021558 [Tritrichomonas musculus]|uniref:Protein kinase domain-containing protein n=1 Tax=Tritrichomonas musculus TaxID=1915356 RepID=A0ABR2KQ57_9EUKA
MPVKPSTTPEKRSPRSSHRSRQSDNTSPSAPVQSSTIINGYKILNEIGQGAFAIVYKAEEIETKNVYAIKAVAKASLGSKDDQNRFQREIDSMAVMRHENIVQLYNFFSDENNFYMVMDYCPNGELYDFIIKNGKIQENTAALLFQQIASAISYCHSYGVAHRDLKPQNILIQKFPFIKVADFGLCGYVKEDELMKTFCGSPAFCAPECISKVNYDGRKSDIWSLGVILFAMLTGEFPWNLSNTSVMVQQILNADYSFPNYLNAQSKDLISKMLKVPPNDRISMEDILKHPFLKLAQTANVVKRHSLTVKPPKLPKLPLNSLEQMTKLSGRESSSGRKSEAGIISPFSEQGTLTINSCREASDDREELPHLSGIMTRSMSLENCGRMSQRAAPIAPSNSNPNSLMPRTFKKRHSLQSRGSLNMTLGSKKLTPLDDL